MGVWELADVTSRRRPHFLCSITQTTLATLTFSITMSLEFLSTTSPSIPCPGYNQLYIRDISPNYPKGLQNYHLCDSDYDRAWSLLVLRVDRKKLISLSRYDSDTSGLSNNVLIGCVRCDSLLWYVCIWNVTFRACIFISAAIQYFLPQLRY